MATLVFCTCHAASAGRWRTRYRPWLDAVLGYGVADHVLMVDDGSPMLPGWPDVGISSGDDVADAIAPGDAARVVLHHFTGRLGRSDVVDFPGWHRSFTFAARYARRHGFERVVHIESDAYLLSPRMAAFFRDYRNGWCALWCEKFKFPEMALQVVDGYGLATFGHFAEAAYGRMVGVVHENSMPFTAVERGFTGDRYGEAAGWVPRDADYACQVQDLLEPSYYWWRGADGNAQAEPGDMCVDLNFGEGGNAGAFLSDGWSTQEPGYRWMINYASVIQLPAFIYTGASVLRLVLGPMLAQGICSQRLTILVNRSKVADFEVTEHAILGADVPAGLLRGNGTDTIRLLHPDAEQVSVAKPGNDDKRRLSLAARRLSIRKAG